MLDFSFVKTERKSIMIRYFSYTGLLILIILLFGGCERKDNIDNMFQLEDPLLKDIKIKSGSSFQIDSYSISLEDGIYE